MVRYTSGELFLVVSNQLLCSPTDTSSVSSTGAFCETPWCHLPGSISGNYHYQNDNATPHHAQVVLDFLQQGNVTKMEQPARSADCNPIELIWDELGHAITSMEIPPNNLGELCQALLDKWAEIPVECLQHLVGSMPRRLGAIIVARGGTTWYWPSIYKTTPTGSIMQTIKFVWPDLPQLPSNDI